jgi:predicted transcriptional regulator
MGAPRFARGICSMYVCIVKRTQIYLTHEEDVALERLAADTGRTKSQLIRQAIDATYLHGATRGRLRRAIRGSAGAWKGRESGAAYVERLRGGRLARVHGSESEPLARSSML